MLKGTRLDEVATMTVNNVVFSPAAALSHTRQRRFARAWPLRHPRPPAFMPTISVAVKVTLKDGRVLDLDSTVQSPRPSVKLMNKSVHLDGPPSVVQLGSQDELPDHATVDFLCAGGYAGVFPRDQKIEVASNDNCFSTVLRVGEGGIVLQDSKTALVTLDPAKAFGGSAFGPLRFRPVSAHGVARGLAAPGHAGSRAALEGAASVPKARRCARWWEPICSCCRQVGADAQLADAVTVPEGFGDHTECASGRTERCISSCAMIPRW